MASPPAPAELFGEQARTLVGVIHLPRLADNDAEALLRRARDDARVYADAGFDAVLVENFGDAPWPKDRSLPHVAAMMGRAVAAAADASGLPVGANVLRNDAQSALAACHAGGGRFVRINVLTGAVVADQGIIEGDAAAVHAYRRVLGLDRGARRVALLADVFVKHAAPLVARPLAELAAETRTRAGADVLLVTGPATGARAALGDVDTVRAAAPGPVWVASGVDAAHVAEVLAHADGVIVGTSVKAHGDVTRPVDARRAKDLVAAAKRVRAG